MARVLVIDDDSSVRYTLRRMLERVGHRVAEASGATEGCRLFSAAPVDVVITDMLMPDGDGIEVIQTLRREHPDVQIIAMSGGGAGSGGHYLEWARLFGAQQILAKPLEVQCVREAVVRAALQGPRQWNGSV